MSELTQNDLMDLKKQGFSEQEISGAVRELEREDLQDSYNQIENRIDPRQYSQHSSFATRPDNDIIRWQLELNDLLERVDHILNGDIVKFENGQRIWKINPTPENNPLNSYGVQEFMRLLSMYINRNTILSDFDKTQIDEKVYDFGRELNALIFKKYEELGMDTEDKRKEYPIIVLFMKDIVHSAYSRALDGGERRSLREMINVSQASTMTNQPMPNMNMQQPSRSILNPMRYISGKYK